MKRIGLIGGVSWHSSLEYYRLLNESAGRKFGSGSAANIVLINVDLNEYDSYLYGGQVEKAKQLLIDAALDAEKAGAALIALCSNGCHCFYDSLESTVNVPIIHIADATGKEIVKQGLTLVGLLGVRRTMEDDFYRSRLENMGITPVIPSDSQREYIHASIFEELIKGDLRDSTRSQYLEIIRDLADKGAQGVILGCTEIPLLITQDDTELPLFPTLDLHCQELIRNAHIFG